MSGWDPIRKVRMHEQVVAQIRQKILKGELTVGARLPSERDLVVAMGVSRSSIRQALRGLEAIGIIHAQGGSSRDAGWVISGRSSEALGNLLRLHVVLTGIDLKDLVDLRVLLERHAVVLAARNRSDIDLGPSHVLVNSMQAGSAAFNEVETDFHLGIGRASSNKLIVALMQALSDAFKAEAERAVSAIKDWRSFGERLLVEHASILEAIENGRGAEGADRVEEHIRRFYRDQLAR